MIIILVIFRPLNLTSNWTVRSTNLIEAHTLNSKRGDSNLQHVLGARARKVKPHLPFWISSLSRLIRELSHGCLSYCYDACPNPHSQLSHLEKPLTQVLLGLREGAVGAPPLQSPDPQWAAGASKDRLQPHHSHLRGSWPLTSLSQIRFILSLMWRDVQ